MSPTSNRRRGRARMPGDARLGTRGLRGRGRSNRVRVSGPVADPCRPPSLQDRAGADVASLRRDQRPVRAPGSLPRQYQDRIHGPSSRRAQAALAGSDLRGRGRSRLCQLVDRALLREAVRLPAQAPRAGAGRPARHRPLNATRLSRYPVRAGAVLDQRFPQCAQELGPRFSSYRTSASADDVNDVRRALGLARITLYGDSYGTFLSPVLCLSPPGDTGRPGA